MANQGYADVVIGTQYGDEGKARVVDDKAANYDVIARFNGGANAGHTVVYEGQKVALKQVPSGIFYKDKLMYTGSGCMVNISKLKDELTSLKQVGIDVSNRLRISPQAGVIQPHHILIDGIIGKSVGTTGNGIGPAYADRAMRMWEDRLLNIRMGDLLENSEKYFGIMKTNFESIAKLHGIDAKVDAELEKMKKDFQDVVGLIEKDTLFLQKKISGGAKVIFEGAQAFMLDVNKGSVPYVTSSGTTASAAYTGGDLSANFHRKTFGIAKVIMSRVGHGPFASEFGGEQSEEYCMSFRQDGSPLHGKADEEKYDLEKLIKSQDPFEVGKAMRILSGEYGTVTSRPRRIGAFDLVQLAYAVKVNGINSLILTKCDLLNCYSRTTNGKIPLVTGYELDGEKIDYIPGSVEAYRRVKPIIEYRPGFSRDISSIRSQSDLPSELRDLLQEVEEKAGCQVEGIGVGPDRDQYIKFN